MSERVNDETLAAIRDALETSPWPSVGGAMTTREALAILDELQQHRARIAAHAAAHPEWLSDGDVSEIIASVGDDGDTAHLEDTLDGDEILSLAVECQQHRTANLAATEQIAAFIERVSLEWEHIPQVADAIAGVAGRVRALRGAL